MTLYYICVIVLYYTNYTKMLFRIAKIMHNLFSTSYGITIIIINSLIHRKLTFSSPRPDVSTVSFQNFMFVFAA